MAVASRVCRQGLREWWQEAARHLALPPSDVDAYGAALLTRFANPRMRHRLEQIAMDGSRTLPARSASGPAGCATRLGALKLLDPALTSDTALVSAVAAAARTLS